MNAMALHLDDPIQARLIGRLVLNKIHFRMISEVSFKERRSPSDVGPKAAEVEAGEGPAKTYAASPLRVSAFNWNDWSLWIGMSGRFRRNMQKPVQTGFV